MQSFWLDIGADWETYLIPTGNPVMLARKADLLTYTSILKTEFCSWDSPGSLLCVLRVNRGTILPRRQISFTYPRWYEQMNFGKPCSSSLATTRKLDEAETPRDHHVDRVNQNF
jgi:hypothetical protein